MFPLGSSISGSQEASLFFNESQQQENRLNASLAQDKWDDFLDFLLPLSETERVAYLNRPIVRNSLNQVKEGITPLMLALAKDLEEVSVKLIASGAIELGFLDEKGESAFHIACSRGHLEAIKKIVELGIDPKLKNCHGFSGFYLAAQHNQPTVLAYLSQEFEWDVNQKEGCCETTALHSAALAGNLEATKQLLNLGANPMIISKDGGSCFYTAAQMGHVEVMKCLFITGKININQKETPLEVTALYIAAYCGRFEAVEKLLEWGADLTLTNIEGMSPFHAAIQMNQTKILGCLFNTGKINTNQRIGLSQLTALRVAINQGHLEIVQKLLEWGADPTLTDTKGLSAFYQAAQLGHVEILKCLFNTGKININQREGLFQITPLYIATKHAKVEAVKKLLEWGADPMLCNAFDQTSALSLTLVIIRFKDDSTSPYSQILAHFLDNQLQQISLLKTHLSAELLVQVLKRQINYWLHIENRFDYKHFYENCLNHSKLLFDFFKEEKYQAWEQSLLVKTDMDSNDLKDLQQLRLILSLQQDLLYHVQDKIAFEKRELTEKIETIQRKITGYQVKRFETLDGLEQKSDDLDIFCFLSEINIGNSLTVDGVQQSPFLDFDNHLGLTAEEISERLADRGLIEGKDFRLVGIDLTLKHLSSLFLSGHCAVNKISDHVKEKCEMLQHIDGQKFASLVQQFEQLRHQLTNAQAETMLDQDKKTLATNLFNLNRSLVIKLLKFLLREENQNHLFVLQNEWEKHYEEEPFALSTLMAGNHSPNWTVRDFYHLMHLDSKNERS